MPSVLHAVLLWVYKVIYVDVWMTAAGKLRVCANGTPSMLFYVTRCSVHTLAGKHIRLRINDDHCAIQLLINLISYSNVYIILWWEECRVHTTRQRVPGSCHYCGPI